MVGSGEAIWSFNDEDEEEEAEPYTFLLKPNEEAAPIPAVSSADERDKRVVLTPEDEARLRIDRQAAETSHLREETHEAAALETDDEHAAINHKDQEVSVSARVVANRETEVASRASSKSAYCSGAES